MQNHIRKMNNAENNILENISLNIDRFYDLLFYEARSIRRMFQWFLIDLYATVFAYGNTGKRRE